MSGDYPARVDALLCRPDTGRDERRRAVHVVCAQATSAEEARRLLAMLGLDPEEGRP